MTMTREEALVCLGFKKTDDPDEDEVRKAYKRLAIQYHPDKHPTSKKAEMEEKFKKAGEACQVLLKPEQEEDSFANIDPFAFFRAFFGDFASPFVGATPEMEYQFQWTRKKRGVTLSQPFYFKDNEDLQMRFPLNFDPTFEVHHFSSLHVPEGAVDIILGCIEKYPGMRVVNFPPGFLNGAQKDRLSKLVAKNKRPMQDIENWHRLVLRGVTIGFLPFAGIGIFFKSFGGLALIGAAILGAALGGLVGYLRYRYVNYARSCYDSHEKIDAASSGEKSALNIGLETTTWKGYLTSFKYSEAYTHPVAFVAGMQVALDENNYLEPKIRACRP